MYKNIVFISEISGKSWFIFVITCEYKAIYIFSKIIRYLPILCIFPILIDLKCTYSENTVFNLLFFISQWSTILLVVSISKLIAPLKNKQLNLMV